MIPASVKKGDAFAFVKTQTNNSELLPQKTEKSRISKYNKTDGVIEDSP